MYHVCTALICMCLVCVLTLHSLSWAMFYQLFTFLTHTFLKISTHAIRYHYSLFLFYVSSAVLELIISAKVAENSDLPISAS